RCNTSHLPRARRTPIVPPPSGLDWPQDGREPGRRCASDAGGAREGEGGAPRQRAGTAPSNSLANQPKNRGQQATSEGFPRCASCGSADILLLSRGVDSTMCPPDEKAGIRAVGVAACIESPQFSHSCASHSDSGSDVGAALGLQAT